MKKYTKSSILSGVMGGLALTLLCDSSAFAQNRYGQTNQNYVHPVNHNARFIRPVTHLRPTGPKKYDGIVARIRGEKHLAYQVRPPYAGPGLFQRWVNWEPEYTLHPGDQLDIVVSSAPELSRTLTVGPDGRIIMPMSRPIMAAGRTFQQVQGELSAELGTQLRDPTLAVTPRAYSPEQIYVGGQVNQPGTYTLPGRIGAIEALLLAGGMSLGARTKEVAILRRSPYGGMMMRTVNIQNGLLNIREYNDNMQLRRGDIIFVPKTALAEVGLFVQALRQTFPIDPQISYTFGNFGGGGGGDVVVPAITPTLTP